MSSVASKSKRHKFPFDPGFWSSRTLWRLAYRAARSGMGAPYFDAHPEFYSWLDAAYVAVAARRRRSFMKNARRFFSAWNTFTGRTVSP